jgi:hypothetical protein
MLQFFKRFFRTAPEIPPVTRLERMIITFPNGQTPIAVKAYDPVNPQSVIETLDLTSPVPVFLVSGGAGAMNTESMAVSRSTLEDGLARFLHEHQVTLLDGGTAAGVMQLIGLARQRRSYTFPLIGVAPDHVVWMPGRERTEAHMADLDAFHTHFVLTSGHEFGAESEMLIQLAYALCGGGVRPRLCIVINGGQIVRREVHRMATQEPRFPILVLDGTGRFADELAAAYRAKQTDDPIMYEILSKGRVHVMHIKAGAEAIRNWLENYCGF